MKNKGLDVISKIVSLFLCFVLFIMICMYIGLLIGPKLISKDNVSTIVNDMDMKEILTTNDSDSLDRLYTIADNNNIDRQIVDGIINSNEFKALISEYYGDVAHYLSSGQEGIIITADKIVQTVDEVLDRTAQELGITLTEEQHDNILIEVEENSSEISNMFPTYDEMKNEINEEDMNVIRILLGDSSKIVLFVMIIIVIAIIAIVRWSIYRFAIWTGVTTVLAGGVFASLGGLGNVAMKLILEEEYSTATIQLVKENIFGTFVNYGLVVLLIGTIQIIYYFMLRNKFNKNEA